MILWFADLAFLTGHGMSFETAWKVAGFPKVTDDEMIEIKKVFEDGTKTS